MGSRACLVLALLVLVLDSTFSGVQAARVAGDQLARVRAAVVPEVDSAVPSLNTPANKPNETKQLDGHYRGPLIDLCSKPNVTMADLRQAAPTVFIKMMQNDVWKGILFGQENLTLALSRMVSAASESMHILEPDCEMRIMSSLFPQLKQILTSNNKNSTSSLFEDLKRAVDQSGRDSLGNIFESAKMFEVLQDRFESSNPQTQFERVNATQIVQKAMATVTSLHAENLLELESGVGAPGAPPNEGDLNERTVKLREINYDAFIRVTLSSILVNSGIILALCYGLAVSTILRGITTDPEGDFVARMQMRNGDKAIDDTAAVEASEFVGGNSLVVGGNTLDQMLYGADFPIQNNIPHPGEANEAVLKAFMLRSDDKALYESLSASGRAAFKKLFGEEPAYTIPNEDVSGVLMKPRGVEPKNTGAYSVLGESSAYDSVKAVLGDQPKSELPERLGARQIAKMRRHLGGFVGSLRMKILRAHLNPRSSASGLRELNSLAMEHAKTASLQDAVELLYFLQGGKESAAEAVDQILDELVGEIKQLSGSGLVVCYYGGTLSPQMETAKEALGSLAISSDDPTFASNCGPVKVRGESEMGSLYLKLDSFRYLPTCEAASESLNQATDSGMTPGAQLRLSQVNTADRIDKLFSIVSSFSLVNLCLVVASHLQETFNQAFRLYKASSLPCETRDPDTMHLFWGVPMPGPACPRFGVAFFPTWLTWLVENAGSFNVMPKDYIGTEVEYACDTAVLPEPIRRTMQKDSLESVVRLTGSLPSCTREPSSYDCAYRDSPLITNRCSTSSVSSLGFSLLPQAVGYNQNKAVMRILMKQVDTTSTSDRASADDSKVKGYYCITDSTFVTTPQNTIVAPKDLGGKLIDEWCSDQCKPGECEAFSYFQDKASDPVTCAWSATTAPIAPVTMTSAAICYRDSGLRLGFLNEANQLAFELRVAPNSVKFKQGSSEVIKQLGEHVSSEEELIISKHKWRYLEIAWTASVITVAPLLRANPEQDNFKWSVDSNPFASFPITASAGTTVRRIGVGCYIAGAIKDVCLVRSGASQDFLYPSESLVIAEPFRGTLKTRLGSTAQVAAEVVQIQLEQAGPVAERAKPNSFFEIVGDWFSKISQNPGKAVPEALVQLEHQALEPARLLGDLLMSIRTAVQGPGGETTSTISDFVTKVFPENPKMQQNVRKLIDKLNLANHVFGPNAEQHRYDFEPNMFLEEAVGVEGFDPTAFIAPFSSSNQADGPMAAASNLSFLYVVGSLFILAYFLAKYRDRLDSKNNVRDKFFNPLLALTPGGQFSKEFGAMPYLFAVGLLLVMLNSSSTPSSNARFIMSEGAKAADLIVRDN